MLATGLVITLAAMFIGAISTNSIVYNALKVRRDDNTVQVVYFPHAEQYEEGDRIILDNHSSRATVIRPVNIEDVGLPR